jgi:esterase/lipase superfamily enzyme
VLAYLKSKPDPISQPSGSMASRLQNLYALYIEQEVVPYILSVCGDPGSHISTKGASFRAFHAANTLFRRPDLFDCVIAMSDFYDLGPDYLKDCGDDR